MAGVFGPNERSRKCHNPLSTSLSRRQPRTMGWNWSASFSPSLPASLTNPSTFESNDRRPSQYSAYDIKYQNARYFSAYIQKAARWGGAPIPSVGVCRPGALVVTPGRIWRALVGPETKNRRTLVKMAILLSSLSASILTFLGCTHEQGSELFHFIRYRQQRKERDLRSRSFLCS